MKSTLILFSSFLMLLVIPVLAQDEYIIEGTVTDAESGKALPFASVFIANTTYGTTSGEDGKFRLELPGTGTYDLIISFTGYETFARSVRLIEPVIVPMDAKLVTKSRQLRGVVVTAKEDVDWKRRLARFKVEFLGNSKNAQACKILNEEVLNFDYDQETGVFEAFAYEPLIIENKELGYRLHYLLENFESNLKLGSNSFFGFTSFGELKPGRRKSKHAEERRKAYLGSMQHFFSTLFAGTTKEEGYELYHAKDIEGTGRVIDKNQVKLKDIVVNGNKSQTKKLVFQDLLYVYYKNEKIPDEYFGMEGLTMRRNLDRNTQNSWIQMKDDEIEILFENNGYVVNPLSLYSFGMWSFEKVGDMMPINYQVPPSPEPKGRKR